MVGSLLHPLNIFIVGLGTGFLIPLLNRLGKGWVAAAFLAALAAMTLISAVCAIHLYYGGEPIEILTGGALPPYAINLRMGLAEAFVATGATATALLGAIYVLREKYAVMLLYLILVMGVIGMIATRDLFNLFVFLEIVSIATYGLLSLGSRPEALSASFKFLMATVVASTFFLLGTMLLYAATGILNIDDLIAAREGIAGPIAFAALMLLLGCLLLELKPFPANGWGLDVYETAPGSIAALVASVVSAGVFFALLKLMPLFEDYWVVIAATGAITFVFANLIGLSQTKAQRLLGYSSVGQMGLLYMAAALLHIVDAKAAMPLVIGGLFINHLLAKAGLFWLAGVVSRERLTDWAGLGQHPIVLAGFGILICAIAGLPPFPGFWAKWQYIVSLASHGKFVWIAIALLGSLLEAAYLFRWLALTLHRPAGAKDWKPSRLALLPVFGAGALLALCGYGAARMAGLDADWIFLPLIAGLAIVVLGCVSDPAQRIAAILTVAAGGYWLVQGMTGIGFLFGALFFAGSAALVIASLYRKERRPGFYPFLVVLLLSLQALPRAATGLEFFVLFEFVTLASYFLILRRPEARSAAFSYVLFSLTSGYCLIAGFAVAHAVTGEVSLSALLTAAPESALAFGLLAAGFLIKAGAVGVHVWLPGAYADSDDDLSAILSAVVSKAPIFGLVVAAYATIRSEAMLDLAYAVGCLGMLTTVVGAVLALRQDDIKRMLAYSSMSQLGYIVAAVALMSHLGWVTALYLTANHLAVKGILFLVAAAVVLRTGRRTFSALGGLVKSMPVTFGIALVGVVAMSGLPPFTGFGGKWLLLSAMMEKGWYLPIALGVLATLVGLLYMVRFIRAIFLGPPRGATHTVPEAPWPILTAQAILIAGILIMTFFPKLLIVPISEAIDPAFASTLVWEGMSLELIYGYWNPLPTMAAAVAVSLLLIAALWLVRRRTARLPGTARSANFYDHYQPLLAAVTPPWAVTFWTAVARSTQRLGMLAGRVYTGNGQAYTLTVFYYFVAVYMVCAAISF
ncbi:proton-conducting transporter membrane subunit [Methyloceanibacter sp.]|uniref:complex I subunit 5 family protein n=1 Tax=Methyloceanibacter sp. TaxID=1965321 RepID=UPI002BCD4C1F|nr:proton-conducting transporter membrane subunit [Methyloceanibacter sp.]HML90763.1 proton-conducting transporter membrane subunit [Methyloceanibacter sp.]